jgi:hypothetical protein
MSREQQVRDVIERFISRVRNDTDTHLEALSSDLLAIVRGDMRTNRDDLDRAAIEIARAVAKGGSHARRDLISRVVVSLRRLDDAMTLSGILDALADGAAEEASRVAVLVADQAGFRAYRHHGFPPGGAPVDVPVDASPFVSSAVGLRQSTTVRAGGDREDPQVPMFMRVAAGQMGVLTPIVVANTVVALVFCEGPDRGADEPAAPVWTEHVEVLIRHASARLENVTSKRTVEVLTRHS